MEPAITRILAMSIFDETGSHVEDLYYTHDLLKNTTALFGIQTGRRALYEYGPYGNILKGWNRWEAAWPYSRSGKCYRIQFRTHPFLD